MADAAVNKVKTLIEQGENQFLEFKEQKVHPDSIAKEIAAFANTQEGTIPIGVSGEDDSKNWEEFQAILPRR